MTIAASSSPPPLPEMRRGNVHKSLPGQRVTLVNYGASGFFTAIADPGTTLEDVLTPVFWSQYTNMLKPLARVNVVSKDAALDVDLRVLTVEPGAIKMRLIDGPWADGSKLNASASKDDETALELPDGYKAAWWENLQGWICNEPNGQSITGGARGLSRHQVYTMAIAHHKMATTPNMPAKT